MTATNDELIDNNENIEDEIIDNNGDDPNDEKKQEGEIDLSKYVSIDEVNKIREALKKANGEAADNRHKYKAFADLGVSPDDVKQIVEERNKKEEARKRQEGKFEELLDQKQNAFEAQLAEKDEMISSAKSQLERYMIDKELSTALAREGVSEKLASPLIRPMIKTYSEEGSDEISVVVMNDDGTVKLNENGKFMNISEYVSSLKEDKDFSALFPAPSRGGLGLNDASGKNSDSWSGPTQRSKMTQDQRIEYQKRFGFDAYAKLPF